MTAMSRHSPAQAARLAAARAEAKAGGTYLPTSDENTGEQS